MHPGCNLIESRKNRRARVISALTAATLSFLFAEPSAAQTTAKPLGVVDDWSFHHLVFSNPGTLADAMRTGTVDRWSKIVQTRATRRTAEAQP